MMLPAGRVGYYYFFIYAEYYFGVIALVALSITIMVGLVSTDRLVLSIRQRVMLQSTHRTTGLIAVSALVVHVWTKVVDTHLPIGIVDAFIPFMAPYNRVLIGFGTISGWIMILVMWTGIARARFIGQDRPWLWRSIHSISYLMWPIALLHGLGAGRPAKTWVNVSYILCILVVLIGLAVRLSVSLNRRKDFSSTMGTSGAVGMRPAGQMVPTASAPVKRGKGGRERAPEPETLGPVAVLDWAPAAPPVMEEPPAPRQRRPREEDGYGEQPRGGRRRPEDDFGYDDPPQRGRYPDDDFSDTQTRMRRGVEDTSARMRRPGMDDTSARMRRPEMDDTSARMRRPEFDDTSARMRPPELDDTSTRMRRVEMDDTSARMRRVEMDDSRYDRRYEEEAPAGRRRAENDYDYDDAPRGRRRADDDYDDIPRQRGGSHYAADGRYGRDEVDAPRARRDRGAYDDESADAVRVDSGRHSRSQFVDADYLEPDETPTLVDMASRRALREAAQQESVRGQSGRGARRDGRGRRSDEAADDAYWSQLRGEAN
jgi:hypothetical protein